MEPDTASASAPAPEPAPATKAAPSLAFKPTLPARFPETTVAMNSFSIINGKFQPKFVFVPQLKTACGLCAKQVDATQMMPFTQNGVTQNIPLNFFCVHCDLHFHDECVSERRFAERYRVFKFAHPTIEASEAVPCPRHSCYHSIKSLPKFCPATLLVADMATLSAKQRQSYAEKPDNIPFVSHHPSLILMAQALYGQESATSCCLGKKQAYAQCAACLGRAHMGCLQLSGRNVPHNLKRDLFFCTSCVANHKSVNTGQFFFDLRCAAPECKDTVNSSELPRQDGARTCSKCLQRYCGFCKVQSCCGEFIEHKLLEKIARRKSTQMTLCCSKMVTMRDSAEFVSDSRSGAFGFICAENACRETWSRR